MQNITFATPTLATAQMAKQDQIETMVNQATSAIVCCYLEHMNTAINKGISGAAAGINNLGQQSASTLGFLTTVELVSLINDVQTALKN